MASRQIRISPQKPLEMNVVSHSPHVVGYRIWTRAAGATGPWDQVADGDTADNIPDSTAIAAPPAGTSLAYWLGIGGNPNSPYQALVILSQGGEILIDGTFIEEGVTNGDGFAVAKNQVELI
jgi:hypothetical protein